MKHTLLILIATAALCSAQDYQTNPDETNASVRAAMAVASVRAAMAVQEEVTPSLIAQPEILGTAVGLDDSKNPR